MEKSRVSLLDFDCLCGELLLDLDLVMDDLLQIYSEDSRRILADIDSLRTWLENNY